MKLSESVVDRGEEGERLLAQRVALARLLTDREKADARIREVESMAGEDGSHESELHKPVGLHLGVGARVEQHGWAATRDGDDRRDRRSADSLDATHPQQG